MNPFLTDPPEPPDWYWEGYEHNPSLLIEQALDNAPEPWEMEAVS
jgi:hypothetical protein